MWSYEGRAAYAEFLNIIIIKLQVVQKNYPGSAR